MAAQGRAEGSESLGGISRAHKCSAQVVQGNLFSPPEGEWLLRPAALAVVSRDLVSDHPPLSGFPVLVCVSVQRKGGSMERLLRAGSELLKGLFDVLSVTFCSAQA